MKRIVIILLCAAVSLISCADLESLYGELDNLDSRTENLEAWLDDIQEDADKLSAVLAAIGRNDYVTDVSVSYDPETLEALSYTVYFSVSPPVTITPVSVDDAKGEDGRKPSVSAGLYEGKYYWMADGKWILDPEGNKLPVDYGDPVEFKVQDGIWYVSYDSGSTWSPIDPFEYSFPGIVDVDVNDSYVRFILADGQTLDVPYESSVSFSLSKEGCVDAVPGATYTITYSISGAKDPSVTILSGDRIGHVSVIPSDETSGSVVYTLDENIDISSQKLLIVLNHSSGTVTRQLTFKQSGRLDIGMVEPIPPSGGECLITSSLEGYQYLDRTVTTGGDWLRFVSTTSYGAIYEADPNPSASARVAEVTFTVKSKYFSPLFTKKLRIVQFGTGDFPSYQEYVGNWIMSGTDRITGNPFESEVRIIENPALDNAYLVYGLSPKTGMQQPVHAVYDSVTGNMRIDVPQILSGSGGTILSAVRMNVGKPSADKESMSFTFRVSRNVMTADMSYETSFMFLGEDSQPLEEDAVFYYDAVLNRSGVAEYYSDGQVVMLNEADDAYTPLNIVILGDGYQTKDLKHGGKFERSARGTVSSFFAVEPFTSFKDRFDIYMVPFASADEGPDVTSTGVVNDTYFSSVCAGGGNTLVTCNYDSVLAEVRKLGFVEDDFSLYRTVVILLVNTTEQSGSCWYIKAGRTSVSNIGDGIMSMAIAMLAADTMGANGLVRHEAGGHAFGRLADEYNWGGTADDAKKASLKVQQDDYGFYYNVSSDMGETSPWSHFIGLEGYGDVGYYEGAWGCSSGLYRPTQSSIMLNNQGQFNAPSREIIYKRIILQTEGPGAYDFDKFLEYDRKNL